MEVSNLKPWNPDSDKIFEGVFGKNTLMTLNKFMNDGVFCKLHGEIQRGKEACIFVGEDKNGSPMVLKIYSVETVDFGNMLPYIRGDVRFGSVKPNRKSLVYAWARKEFSNLARFENAGVRVPHPIACRNNVLVMEFIGDDSAAPTLRDVVLEKPKAVFDRVCGYMRLAYKKAHLVHADLSEYNILFFRDAPIIIDCGQAVLTSHPNAEVFLERDAANVAKYFKRLGVKTDKQKMLSFIRG